MFSVFSFQYSVLSYYLFYLKPPQVSPKKLTNYILILAYNPG